MVSQNMITVDGNEAAASVAYRTNEVIAIYPITPSSPMGELADAWAAQRQPNIWGGVPDVVEMQSEGGAAGAVHGALQAGALATTFTASQGLLLMIPNMYKIAGELTPFCMHVAARTLATHALSIFGDHSDVMAARQTGFALLASGSVQEAQDLACIAHAATLAARVPFLHFFDGFRTSHEVAKIAPLSDDDLRAMIDDDLVGAHRAARPDARPSGAARHGAESRCLLPGARGLQPVLRRLSRHRASDHGPLRRAHRPPVPAVRLRRRSRGRARHRADGLRRRDRAGNRRVAGAARRARRACSRCASTARSTSRHFAAALPATVRAIAVLDRTKEPGAVGEPLYLDVVGARARGARRRTTHGGAAGGRRPLRAGLEGVHARRWCAPSSTTLAASGRATTSPSASSTTSRTPRCRCDADFDIEPDDCVRAVFYGLGSDGTVGANKNSIKIIGEDTDNCAQGYFVYDSKKAGAVTISHLRFGPRPIRSAYLIRRASFVACHQFEFLDRFDVLEHAWRRAAPSCSTRRIPPSRCGTTCRARCRRRCSKSSARLFVIDAYAVAREAGLGVRINTIMQTCFFAIAGVLPRGRGDRPHQGRHRQDLRQARPGGRRAEQRRGRRRAGPPARGGVARGGELRPARARRSSPPQRRTSSSGSPR